MDQKNKKILEKQLELLSERSKDQVLAPHELAELTHAMCEITDLILEIPN